MVKKSLCLILMALGLVEAEPLTFYIEPGTGLASWNTPLVKMDAVAVRDARGRMVQAQTRYEQGLGDALSCLKARLEYLELVAPLVQGEKAHLMHRGELFKTARQIRQVVESRHQAGGASNEELYKAQLDDAWFRARQIHSAAPDVYIDQLKRAGEALGKLSRYVQQQKTAGMADRVAELLVEAAQGELRLAEKNRAFIRETQPVEDVQKIYDELAELMTAREQNGMCEADAAASAREAARIFRREFVLQSREVSAEAVAARQECCEIYESLIPLIPGLLENASKEETFWLKAEVQWAPCYLEYMQRKLREMQSELQKEK